MAATAAAMASRSVLRPIISISSRHVGAVVSSRCSAAVPCEGGLQTLRPGCTLNRGTYHLASATLGLTSRSFWSSAPGRTSTASTGTPTSTLHNKLLAPVAGSDASCVSGPMAMQARFAGRILGLKRKKKNCRPRTVWQKGLGKRMEMFWPKRAHRTRVPLYENSRQHVIFDHRFKRWLVMWYRHGMQVFRSFPAHPAVKFERARAKAIVFYKQLKNAGKLGRPKPDACRSGVRGVFFDIEERAWVARWSDSGRKKNAVYSTIDKPFQQAYRQAVECRLEAVRRNHQFVFQRTRWKGQRKPLGTPHT
eukprot:TRINITY_DN31061_c0_g1_i2.p1 TRINITY_DN31061_c0_g1~~TRINITY_DN31061_c0_g1_i2.p1  ORF type:complete len:322 (+),score=25.68 TRINITY_DN31061_c0_g1_i2:46-966(+)